MQGVQNIQIDVSIGHGNSGGPIVNEQGVVVGISASGLTNSQDEKAVYAVNIDEVLTLLKLHSVPHTMASDSRTGGSRVLLLAAAASDSDHCICGAVKKEEHAWAVSGACTR